METEEIYMKTFAHVIPHSHWDREWYIPFEHHRARLVALMDSVLELLETEEYSSKSEQQQRFYLCVY